MPRILYGAPESEREEENGLVAKLRDRRIITYQRSKRQVTYIRETHQVEYLNYFLGFAFELSRCKDSLLLPQKYDLVIYDTKAYGENWLPEIRAENFKKKLRLISKGRKRQSSYLPMRELKTK